MDSLEDFVVTLRRQLCIPGWSESDIREFVAALEITSPDPDTFLVTSTGGIRVQFVVGSDGNFSGAYMQVAGIQIPLIFGTNSTNMQIFKGSPSGTNPGPGWELEVELSRTILNQTGSENTWTAFLASRAPVINTF